MRRRLFIVTAAISLVLLAIVTAALFSSAAVMVQSNDPTTAPPISRTRSIVKLYHGQVEIFRHDYPPGVTLPATGDRYSFEWAGISMPGGRMITGFAARDLPPNSPFGPTATTIHYIAFPVLCLAIPFAIVPAGWYWKWRRNQRERRMDSSTAFQVGFEQ